MYCQTRISESTRIGKAPGRGPSLAIVGLSASPGQGPVHSQTALDRGRLGQPGNRAVASAMPGIFVDRAPLVTPRRGTTYGSEPTSLRVGRAALGSGVY